jgi:nondiscriminating aspartyl-tRNA synthetase
MFKTAILSGQLPEHIGETVSLRGHLHTVRTVGANLAFLILRDRNGLSQVVIEDPAEIAKLDGALMGSIVLATGMVAQMPKGKFPFELQKSTVEVLNKVIYPSPVDISKETINADGETLHDNKVVVLRHPRQQKIFKIAGMVEKYMRAFRDENDFTQINSPKII